MSHSSGIPLRVYGCELTVLKTTLVSMSLEERHRPTGGSWRLGARYALDARCGLVKGDVVRREEDIQNSQIGRAVDEGAKC